MGHKKEVSAEAQFLCLITFFLKNKNVYNHCLKQPEFLFGGNSSTTVHRFSCKAIFLSLKKTNYSRRNQRGHSLAYNFVCAGSFAVLQLQIE